MYSLLRGGQGLSANSMSTESDCWTERSGAFPESHGSPLKCTTLFINQGFIPRLPAEIWEQILTLHLVSAQLNPDSAEKERHPL